MNIINIDINFKEGTNKLIGIPVITGDYASTKLVFHFDREDGTKVFEMKNPSGEIRYAGEIINNEVVLTGVDDGHNYSIFNEAGRYIYEVSLYKSDSKLTSVHGELPVAQEQIIIDGEVIEPYLPIFDELMQDISAAITETNNLNIEAEKVNKTTTITITDKDGVEHTTEVLDGIDGTSLENIEINNNDLKVTYGGSTENLGQVCPTINVGTTTTGLPNTQAVVENVGTALNPIFNFTIPKGEAGAIKMIIVAELPETGADDTIYLVPITPDISGNNYAEYVYINGAWELLGKIGVQVDLTDYVKNTDYATPTKAGVIKVSNYYDTQITSEGTLNCKSVAYSSYPNESNNIFISKGTLENVITGKGLVSNTDYATFNNGGTIKVNTDYNTNMYNGSLFANTIDYATYQSKTNNSFISKGTLENVITGKGLVSNTDYATTNNAGLIKASNYYGTAVDGNNGNLKAVEKTYENYTSAASEMFISKGTLENVLTAKIGDIDSVLDAINGEVI